MRILYLPREAHGKYPHDTSLARQMYFKVVYLLITSAPQMKQVHNPMYEHMNAINTIEHLFVLVIRPWIIGPTACSKKIVFFFLHYNENYGALDRTSLLAVGLLRPEIAPAIGSKTRLLDLTSRKTSSQPGADQRSHTSRMPAAGDTKPL